MADGRRAVPDRRRAALRPLRRSAPAAAAPSRAARPSSCRRCTRCSPRLMRLMVALRAALLGPLREECSFLFAVEGRGRPGMGLHHDGPVDAFWLQLEGRRTVTLGPPVAPGTPAGPRRPRAAAAGAAGARSTCAPGTLFHLPPWTPHDVVCHGRSLALSLTWRRARRARPTREPGRARRAGRLGRRLRPRRRGPRGLAGAAVDAGPGGRGTARAVPVRARHAGRRRPPSGAAPRGRIGSPSMPSFAGAGRRERAPALALLLSTGSSAPRTFRCGSSRPTRRALDGWRFARRQPRRGELPAAGARGDDGGGRRGENDGGEAPRRWLRPAPRERPRSAASSAAGASETSCRLARPRPISPRRAASTSARRSSYVRRRLRGCDRALGGRRRQRPPRRAIGRRCSRSRPRPASTRRRRFRSTSVMWPERLTCSSRSRRRRVMSRGEPGGRLKPRALSALASVSSVTVRPRRGPVIRSRATPSSSSCGAVCGSLGRARPAAGGGVRRIGVAAAATLVAPAAAAAVDDAGRRADRRSRLSRAAATGSGTGSATRAAGR